MRPVIANGNLTVRPLIARQSVMGTYFNDLIFFMYPTAVVCDTQSLLFFLNEFRLVNQLEQESHYFRTFANVRQKELQRNPHLTKTATVSQHYGQFPEELAYFSERVRTVHGQAERL